MKDATVTNYRIKAKKLKQIGSEFLWNNVINSKQMTYLIEKFLEILLKRKVKLECLP